MRIGDGATLQRTVGPILVPLTVAELKDHRRIEISGEEELIEMLGEAATEAVENMLSRALLTQTWVLKLDRFPTCGEIRLPRPPLASVTSVVYVDTDGANQTMSAGDYVVDTTSDPGRIYLGYDKEWPDTRDQPLAVTITYVAGFTAKESVSPSVRMVIHGLVGDLYEHREGQIIGTTESTLPIYDRLLAEHRLYTGFEW